MTIKAKYKVLTALGTYEQYDLETSVDQVRGLSDKLEELEDVDSAKVDKSSLIDTIYPVGSIYMSTVATSPAILFQRGTWERIGEGKCLIDAGNNYTAGSTGGSADAIVPYHTHTFTGSAVNTGTQSANHTHTFSGTTSADGAHAHSNRMSAGDSGVGYCTDGNDPNGQYTSTSSAGNHTHTYSGTTSGVSANHTHSVTAQGTNSYAGTSGNAAGANMPPYLAVYMWKRVADATV